MFDPVLVLPSLPFRTYETLVESYVPVCTYLSMHARPCRASNCIYECMLKSWEGEDYSPLLASIVHRFLLHIKLWKPLRIEHRTFLANQSYDAFSLPLPASPCLSLPLHPRATSQLEAMLRRQILLHSCTYYVLTTNVQMKWTPLTNVGKYSEYLSIMMGSIWAWIVTQDEYLLPTIQYRMITFGIDDIDMSMDWLPRWVWIDTQYYHI